MIILKKGILLTLIPIIIVVTATVGIIFVLKNSQDLPEEPPINKETQPEEVEEPDNIREIVISFVGDCTLGQDNKFGYHGRFNYYFDRVAKGDYSYFFGGVIDVLANDDYTVANLEGTLTTSNDIWEKSFNFKGYPSYVNILKQGSVEAVNIANNHIFDFREAGMKETINTLKAAGIDYFGYEDVLVKNIGDINVGFFGLSAWGHKPARKRDIENAINKLKELEAEVIIFNFHAGIEGSNYPDRIQQEMSRYAIDLGADLVIGHHVHVLQGIEYYKGKYIVYSLANFVFGGNSNPIDKDTMILQAKINIENDVKSIDLNIIPASVSGVTHRNDFRPRILEGKDADRVIRRINEYSKNLNFQYSR